MEGLPKCKLRVSHNFFFIFNNKIMLPLIDAYTKTSLAMRIINVIRNLLTKYLFWLVLCEVVTTQKQSAIFLKKIAITNPRKQSIRQGV